MSKAVKASVGLAVLALTLGLTGCGDANPYDDPASPESREFCIENTTDSMSIIYPELTEAEAHSRAVATCAGAQ